MVLKKVLLGWLLIAGMILYAIALTAIHAGRAVVDHVGSLVGGHVSTPNGH